MVDSWCQFKLFEFEVNMYLYKRKIGLWSPQCVVSIARALYMLTCGICGTCKLLLVCIFNTCMTVCCWTQYTKTRRGFLKKSFETHIIIIIIIKKLGQLIFFLWCSSPTCSKHLQWWIWHAYTWCGDKHLQSLVIDSGAFMAIQGGQRGIYLGFSMAFNLF